MVMALRVVIEINRHINRKAVERLLCGVFKGSSWGGYGCCERGSHKKKSTQRGV